MFFRRIDLELILSMIERDTITKEHILAALKERANNALTRLSRGSKRRRCGATNLTGVAKLFFDARNKVLFKHDSGTYVAFILDIDAAVGVDEVFGEEPDYLTAVQMKRRLALFRKTILVGCCLHAYRSQFPDKTMYQTYAGLIKIARDFLLRDPKVKPQKVITALRTILSIQATHSALTGRIV